MEDQYGMADLRQYIIGGRPFFPSISPPPDLSSFHRSFASDNNPYHMLNFRPENSTSIAPPGVTITAVNTGVGLTAGFETSAGGEGRWPRQETLTLLEIRSRLDLKFKEANQKGPLWDEVSRIMCEEYGYQRSSKKCREKFENLYKYYKKTKGGKAGRQDGKHYRFFRQLEALYGDQTCNNNNNNSSASISETNFVGANFQYDFLQNTNSLLPNNNNNNQQSYTSLISISNSSDFDTIITSDDDSELNVLEIDANNDPKKKKKMWKRSLKAKIKDSIDAQMKKMEGKQEAWMEKMMKTIEENEKERILREEQWRKQDAERIEREKNMWASEKAWIEARDAALMDAFGKLTEEESRVSPHEDLIIVQNLSENRNDTDFGHERNGGLVFKENWDCVSDYLIKCNQKRKDNSRISTYHDHHTHESISEQGIDNGNSTRENAVNDNFFRYFNGDAYGRNIN